MSIWLCNFFALAASITGTALRIAGCFAVPISQPCRSEDIQGVEDNRRAPAAGRRRKQAGMPSHAIRAQVHHWWRTSPASTGGKPWRSFVSVHEVASCHNARSVGTGEGA